MRERPTADVVTQVFGDLLGVAPGLQDDFFDLGGHSMLAVLAMAELSEAVGVELDVALIFDHPTCGELAAVIDRARSGTRAA